MSEIEAEFTETHGMGGFSSVDSLPEVEEEASDGTTQTGMEGGEGSYDIFGYRRASHGLLVRWYVNNVTHLCDVMCLCMCCCRPNSLPHTRPSCGTDCCTTAGMGINRDIKLVNALSEGRENSGIGWSCWRWVLTDAHMRGLACSGSVRRVPQDVQFPRQHCAAHCQ